VLKERKKVLCSFVCISAYANAYFETTLRECLRAGLPPGFHSTAPPPVRGSAVLGTLAVGIPNQKNQNSGPGIRPQFAARTGSGNAHPRPQLRVQKHSSKNVKAHSITNDEDQKTRSERKTCFVQRAAETSEFTNIHFFLGETRFVVGCRHCAAVLFSRVPKKCTHLNVSLLYILILRTYSKFAHKKNF